MATREIAVTKPKSATQEGAEKINLSDVERLISALGGGALAAYGLRRKDLAGAAMAVAGGGLLARGVTGHCPVNEAIGRNTAAQPCFPLKVESIYTINCQPEQLYAFWRKLENLPSVMSHLESVKDLGDNRSHWVAKAPGDRKVEWDARIINDVPNETIAWAAEEGSDIDNAGTVRFQKAPGNRGTELHVTLEYAPPGGKLGALLAKVMGEEPQVQIDEDLRHFKEMMEAGEVPTIEGQPAGKVPQESILVAAMHPSR